MNEPTASSPPPSPPPDLSFEPILVNYFPICADGPCLSIQWGFVRPLIYVPPWSCLYYTIHDFLIIISEKKRPGLRIYCPVIRICQTHAEQIPYCNYPAGTSFILFTSEKHNVDSQTIKLSSDAHQRWMLKCHKKRYPELS